MIKNITTRLPKRKLNVFLICLICSFLAWSVSKLSETHTDATSFALDFTNVPDSLVLDKDFGKNVELRVRASGFQFLGLQFGNRRLDISLNGVRQGPAGYFLPRHLFLSQIERQLPGSVELMEVNGDTLYVAFMKLQTKKVPVVGNITIDLGQNHLLEGRIHLIPDSIVLSGPASELDSINRLETLPVSLRSITESIDMTVGIKGPDGVRYTSLSDSTVRLTAEVFRFSEKIVQVPVTVINLPEGTEIKTFPASIPVLCKARIENLKALDPGDFRLTADYSSLKQSQSYLQVSLEQKPEEAHSAQLLEERIEFILKRE